MWIALAKGGFVVPEGQRAIDLLTEMNALLASPDPVLRDEVASARRSDSDAVFAWGENDRVALALHSAVRRADADAAALETWTAHWVEAQRALWSGGPQVDPRRFAIVENAKQVMRGLHVALSMEASPTSTGEAARKTLLATLAKMR